MAVIKKNKVSLKALTATALSLPGMMAQPAFAAEGDEVDFQYSHYQEGKRDIYIDSDHSLDNPTVQSKSFNPIEVDSLHGHANISLTDRVKFAFNYNQDTWGGATPIITVPGSAGGNSAISSNGTIVGASPFVTGAGLRPVNLDANLNILEQTKDTDPITGLPIYKNYEGGLSHVMSTASPEIRNQGDFKLSYDWDNTSASVGGGISIEDDYDSRFGNIGARFDFNQKRTTLNVDLSYTNSYTHATLDHDDYTKQSLLPNSQFTEGSANVGPLIHGTRQDWATHLGLTQVINKDVLISTDFSYTRSTGYLSNPYKGVGILFIDPDPVYQSNQGAPEDGFIGSISAFTEKRPEVRNQYSVGSRYVQYIQGLDAALHVNYQFSADDWGIQAHTFDTDWVQPVGNGWTVTPHVRYYSQDAASFYTPYLVSMQAETKIATAADGNFIHQGSDGKDYSYKNDQVTGGFVSDANGNPIYFDDQGNPAPPSVTVNVLEKNINFDPNKLPANYSSDHRLSGFGTLSGGVTVTKQFAKGLTLETGFEYYTHQGSLKIGGGGEGAYADFDYWLANATLKVNLEALSLRSASNGNSEHIGHDHHDHGAHAPAGVMFDHMLPAGKFMVGYRFMWNSQSGDMLNGTNAVSDQNIVSNGCVEPGSKGCFLTPDSMSMSMHMLDLMYAPTDWLTLMLMPQFVDMHMAMRKLDNSPDASGLGNVNMHLAHHSQNPHETGGIGDLGMYALLKVFDNGTHHVHATAGFSAPTGDVNIQIRRTHTQDGGYHDYGMQLGSGTWDFKPSLTYTGHIDDWSWGLQANGIVHMEDHNRSGYRLGDLFQATGWGSYSLTHWLSASVRGVYTVQDAIKGQFNGADGQFSSILKFGPQDYPQNYGGRFWDVGFGLSAVVPGDSLLGGNRVSVEWLQPVHTDVNGYQLDRDGALSATWSVMF